MFSPASADTSSLFLTPAQERPAFWSLAACSGSALFLAAVLSLQPGLRHQGSSIGRLLSGLAGRREPVLLIATDDLPDGSALELITTLRQQLGPQPLRVAVFLEDDVEPQRLGALLQAGVQSLGRLEAFDGERLNAAIAAASGSIASLDPLFVDRLLQPAAATSGQGDPQLLPSRERQLLQLVGQGYNAIEIASRLAIRADTVRRYLSQAYQRIGVRDRAQAVGWCLSHGLITRQELDRRYRPCPAPAVR